MTNKELKKDTKKLKPCPFCANTDFEFQEPNGTYVLGSFYSSIYIICECGVKMEEGYVNSDCSDEISKDAVTKLISRWNNRQINIYKKL